MLQLTLDHVVKRYDDFTLDLSLALPQGSILGLIGRNGAGKSTTINLILDAIQPDSGRVDIFGQGSMTAAMREQVGVVYAECSFPEELNATELCRVFGGCYRQFDKARYLELLQQFGLPAKKKIKDFSRGMQMKLSLAVAFSHHATLLLLDEPTSGLDPIARQETLDMLWEFIQNEQCSVILSSHITTDLEKVADYIAYIDDGKLLLMDEKDRLLEDYCLVRGGASQLTPALASILIGVSQNSFGFEGLARRAELDLQADLTIQPASLEDIMLHLIK